MRRSSSPQTPFDFILCYGFRNCRAFCIHTCTYMYACGDLRSTLGIFLNCLPSCLLVCLFICIFETVSHCTWNSPMWLGPSARSGGFRNHFFVTRPSARSGGFRDHLFVTRPSSWSGGFRDHLYVSQHYIQHAILYPPSLSGFSGSNSESLCNQHLDGANTVAIILCLCECEYT